ncbi:riboflavin synthase, partial [candidate division KSB1 bacterium]
GRFNGHFVLGHVDGTGKIDQIQKSGDNFEIVIKCDPETMKYIVQKGSVCIDGISLTIAEVVTEGFKIAVIPFTFENTILKYKNKESSVNIETDIIGRYVYKFMNLKDQKDLNFDLLKKYGF